MRKKNNEVGEKKMTIRGPRVVGEVVLRPLNTVKANTWNPNEFTPFLFASLKQGLQKDGWLISQALLVWGTDDQGQEQNIIIDGEHRWRAALELGFKEAPMVFLEGLPRTEAMALTIKMDAKRGKFRRDALADLTKELTRQTELFSDEDTNLSLSLGIEDEDMMKLLAEPGEILEGLTAEPSESKPSPPPGKVESGMTDHVRMVQLFFQHKEHDEFLNLIKSQASRYNTANVTATVLEVLRHANPAT